MPKRQNYLNNKELLKEIHKSKLSFCYIEDKQYYLIDGIIHSMDDLTDQVIADAKQTRADRIANERHATDLVLWENTPGRKAKDKPRLITYKFDGSEIPLEDIVIRKMTFEHVPEEPGRKNKPKTVADRHAKCNFPPFIHIAWRNNKWDEVVRSHWTGDLTNGQFSVKKGKITEKLASMMIMLCQRYSMRSNWRGYTYVDEMRSHALVQLSQIGLYFDESKSANPFAYYTAAITNSFTRVLNLEKRNQNLRDDLLQEAGQTPSFTRQIDDETAQRKAREEKQSEYHDKMEQDMKDAGYNIIP
tara:strand:- start:3271 stop:4176 length:906 start_codon:yes stop_codon:yes gene_type:complete